MSIFVPAFMRLRWGVVVEGVRPDEAIRQSLKAGTTFL